MSQLHPFRMGFDFPENHPRAKYFFAVMEDLVRAAGAARPLVINPDNILFPGAQTIDAIQGSQLDVGWMNAAHLERLHPALSALNLPFGLSDDAMTDGAYQDRLLDVINTCLRPEGLAVAAIMRGADQVFAMFDGPLYALGDLTGKRIRVAGPGVYEDLMYALGATPVVMPITDLREAVTQRAIDGVFTSPGAWQTLLAGDLNFISRVPGLMMITYVAIVSTETLRDPSFAGAHESLQRNVSRNWDRMREDDNEILVQAGKIAQQNVISRPAEWKNAVQELWRGLHEDQDDPRTVFLPFYDAAA
ncbi:TRAP transporter substrate-binding protein [Roseovarius sp.]|uniref:TRAP transporter substrate-binding protein n=1 Tax=Roseovarius sp. TaxID=1486281 RepID=UPI003A982C53